ncbi:hypothetical protein [Bradyrhizobium viridifuturi]|uniref:hypothetical protein n=1 Tax=Bradyrhizobium viridifuturi TaxID=1654716 RepID=UPI00067F61CF|nr:hypothetical protein [Bradyrhizobium viridifuturi]PAY07396.1 hypothetical protein CK489_16685 [Bradyrhizobium sp. UFLA03-84]
MLPLLLLVMRLVDDTYPGSQMLAPAAVDPEIAQPAVDVGMVFLAELRNQRGNDSVHGETS